MRTCFSNSLRRTLKDFRNDQSGIALIYVTAALPVLIGFSLLAIDVGRLPSLQSSLQHGADALALAGAGELDRRPDAIVRANRAIAELVTTNTSLFATSVVTIDENSIGTPCFLSSLPASDSTPIVSTDCLPATTTTEIEESSASARFVQVIVTPQNFNTIFPVTFLGGASNSAQSSAMAVAGFDAAVCDFTPLFICNPYEGGEISIHEAAADPELRKRQLRFHSVPGGSTQLASGNFGLLRAPNDPSPPEMRRMLAKDRPGACFIQNGVDTKPGMSGVGNWLNVRFDLYKQGSTFPLRNDPAYRPAENVRKGYKLPSSGPTPQCNKVPDDTGSSKGLPRDLSFAGCNPPSIPCPFMGDGNFTVGMAEYWLVNYQTSLPLELVGKSRYDVYRYEITNNLMPRQSLAPTLERGNLYCSSSTPTPDFDRRILFAAVLNCQEHDIRGNETDVPAEAFAEFFLTEPASHDKLSGPETFWVELKSIVLPGDLNSTSRDIVQLYR